MTEKCMNEGMSGQVATWISKTLRWSFSEGWSLLATEKRNLKLHGRPFLVTVASLGFL
jgi:hypothetical protein